MARQAVRVAGRVPPLRYSIREGAHAAVRGGARLGAVAGSAMAHTTQATSRGDARARRHVPLHLRRATKPIQSRRLRRRPRARVDLLGTPAG